MIPRASHSDLSDARVLLVHPGIYDDWRTRAYPPWGPLYVASACRQRGAETYVADLNGEDVAERMRELIVDFEPTVIGVLAKLGKGAERMCQAVATATKVSAAPICVGGPLVALFPDLDHYLWEGVHTLIQGDGEAAFADWIAEGCPRTGTIEGSPADLDHLGLPTWWEGLGEYVSDGEHWPGLDVRSVHVSAARGCTRRCTFCYLTSHQPGRGFRGMDSEVLLEGFDALRDRWGAEGFYFVDDCILQPGHPSSENLLDKLVKRGAPYRFGGDVQIQELADAEFLKRIYAAGFRALYVGVEAASASVRKRLGKAKVEEPLETIIARALDLGFVIRASVGVGWPSETEAEMRETLRLLRAVPELTIDAFRYTPLPSAPLTKYWSRQQSSAEAVEHDPFGDYSEYGSNYSNCPDEQMAPVWEELQAIEVERHELYFSVEPGH